MICPHSGCGAECRPGASFCGTCGKRISPEQAGSRSSRDLGARVGGAAAAVPIPPTNQHSRPEQRPAHGQRAVARARTMISDEEERALAGWLVVLRSTHLAPYSDVPLYQGRNLLGRDNWPVPLHDMGVSGQHALINISAEQAVLTDLSRHGTAVNNTPTMSHVLAEGDRIKMGKTVLVYVPFHGPAGH